MTYFVRSEVPKPHEKTHQRPDRNVFGFQSVLVIAQFAKAKGAFGGDQKPDAFDLVRNYEQEDRKPFNLTDELVSVGESAIPTARRFLVNLFQLGG